jgi:ferredoxin
MPLMIRNGWFGYRLQKKKFETRAKELLDLVGLGHRLKHKPREMSGGEYRKGDGFYPDGMSNFALCIRCGDCVTACEGTTARSGQPTPLRMGFLPEKARDSAAPEHSTPQP